MATGQISPTRKKMFSFRTGDGAVHNVSTQEEMRKLVRNRMQQARDAASRNVKTSEGLPDALVLSDHDMNERMQNQVESTQLLSSISQTKLDMRLLAPVPSSIQEAKSFSVRTEAEGDKVMSQEEISKMLRTKILRARENARPVAYCVQYSSGPIIASLSAEPSVSNEDPADSSPSSKGSCCSAHQESNFCDQQGDSTVKARVEIETEEEEKLILAVDQTVVGDASLQRNDSPVKGRAKIETEKQVTSVLEPAPNADMQHDKERVLSDADQTQRKAISSQIEERVGRRPPASPFRRRPSRLRTRLNNNSAKSFSTVQTNKNRTDETDASPLKRHIDTSIATKSPSNRATRLNTTESPASNQSTTEQSPSRQQGREYNFGSSRGVAKFPQPRSPSTANSSPSRKQESQELTESTPAALTATSHIGKAPGNIVLPPSPKDTVPETTSRMTRRSLPRFEGASSKLKPQQPSRQRKSSGSEERERQQYQFSSSFFRENHHRFPKFVQETTRIVWQKPERLTMPSSEQLPQREFGSAPSSPNHSSGQLHVPVKPKTTDAVSDNVFTFSSGYISSSSFASNAETLNPEKYSQGQEQRRSESNDTKPNQHPVLSSNTVSIDQPKIVSTLPDLQMRCKNVHAEKTEDSKPDKDELADENDLPNEPLPSTLSAVLAGLPDSQSCSIRGKDDGEEIVANGELSVKLLAPQALSPSASPKATPAGADSALAVPATVDDDNEALVLGFGSMLSDEGDIEQTPVHSEEDVNLDLEVTVISECSDTKDKDGDGVLSSQLLSPEISADESADGMSVESAIPAEKFLQRQQAGSNTLVHSPVGASAPTLPVKTDDTVDLDVLLKQVEGENAETDEETAQNTGGNAVVGLKYRHGLLTLAGITVSSASSSEEPFPNSLINTLLPKNNTTTQAKNEEDVTANLSIVVSAKTGESCLFDGNLPTKESPASPKTTLELSPQEKTVESENEVPTENNDVANPNDGKQELPDESIHTPQGDPVSEPATLDVSKHSDGDHAASPRHRDSSPQNVSGKEKEHKNHKMRVMVETRSPKREPASPLRQTSSSPTDKKVVIQKGENSATAKPVTPAVKATASYGSTSCISKDSQKSNGLRRNRFEEQRRRNPLQLKKKADWGKRRAYLSKRAKKSAAQVDPVSSTYSSSKRFSRWDQADHVESGFCSTFCWADVDDADESVAFTYVRSSDHTQDDLTFVSSPEKTWIDKVADRLDQAAETVKEAFDAESNDGWIDEIAVNMGDSDILELSSDDVSFFSPKASCRPIADNGGVASFSFSVDVSASQSYYDTDQFTFSSYTDGNDTSSSSSG